MPTEILGVRANLMDAQAKRETLISDHALALSKVDKKIKELERIQSAAASGIDLDRMTLAETVLRVTGDPGMVRENHGVRDDAIQFAMDNIASEPCPLATKYVGVKNYDRFGDQREDHNYGYVPRHGDIVFSIGSLKRSEDWTPEERDAALYYLLNIGKIAKAKEPA